MSHLDVVPPGELLRWKTDPFSVTVDGDLLYGRGGRTTSRVSCPRSFAALAFPGPESGPVHVKLLFVADEEVGSAHGIQFLLREHGVISGRVTASRPRLRPTRQRHDGGCGEESP
jgi:succinyl-diaminopimelate desuccinylase